MIFFRTICFMLFAIPCVTVHLNAMQELPVDIREFQLIEDKTNAFDQLDNAFYAVEQAQVVIWRLLRSNWEQIEKPDCDLAIRYNIIGESEHGWDLFTRYTNIVTGKKEVVFINRLAKENGLADKIICDSGASESILQEIMIWVRKDALEEFQRIFDLEIK